MAIVGFRSLGIGVGVPSASIVFLSVGVGKDKSASQFYITTGQNLYNLDDKNPIFGQVTEGFDVLEAINDVPCDEKDQPLQNIRCFTNRIEKFLAGLHFLNLCVCMV